MFLHTVGDKGSPQVTIMNIFGTAEGRTFLVLHRTTPYAGRPAWFLGELTDEYVSKRLLDGGEESYQKILVHQAVPTEDMDFVTHKPPGVYSLPLFGLKRLRSLTGGGKLTFPMHNIWEQIVGDRMYKLVTAESDHVARPDSA